MSQSGVGGICSPALIVALKEGVVFLNLGLQSVFFWDPCKCDDVLIGG